ncbi:unannotated protein [freshwater metagenome]|uniref:Unannotated protein n=1 Tax=freshwater metagenome TaxID=449393 RepID=A0A6J6TQL3_9ZZZZ
MTSKLSGPVASASSLRTQPPTSSRSSPASTIRVPDRARRDVQIDRGASLPERLEALWEAWVQAFPNVIPRLEMEWENVTELDSHRRLS